MATTRYIVAATPSSPAEKTIANGKSAKREADARAKLDRVDVIVRTEATGKEYYTAAGAPLAAAPAPEEAAPAAEQAETETAVPEFAALVAEVQEEAAAGNSEEQTEAAPEKNPERRAACGCLVEKIVASGEHGKGCTDAPQKAARAKSVKRDVPEVTRTGGATGRRPAQGESAVSGWELLYDKPSQKAQVGRKDGKYGLICTTHKTVRKLEKLVQERALRKAGGWCAKCPKV